MGKIKKLSNKNGPPLNKYNEKVQQVGTNVSTYFEKRPNMRGPNLAGLEVFMSYGLV